MKVAVVGAGLAGLATCYFSQVRGHEVTLFDLTGVGGGASGASTGLLHPFVGKTAKKSWMADEGMEATDELLNIAERELGMPVASHTGIFRPAITEEQRESFQKNQSARAIWKEILLPGNHSPLWGLWIEEGITVFSKRYLEGLFLACKKKGASFVRDRFSLSSRFDRIVYATGAGTLELKEALNLQFRTAIGQSLLCKWKEPFDFSVTSRKYIAVTENPKYCQIGSTYEHTDRPDPAVARSLLDEVGKFCSQANRFEVVEIRSGKRVSPKEGHKPIIEKIDPKTWVFTGLGSRGLLYHALGAKALVSSL